MARLQLVSFDICPFVQRSAIALEEKGVEYDLTFIDLQNKPDWFLAISPRGKVPLLQVDDAVLFESTAILEYLDETTAPRLHREDPIDRARDRAWFSIADELFGAVWRMMIAADADAFESAVASGRKALEMLAGDLVGPLWHGEDFTALDAVAGPGLLRLLWLDALHPDAGIFDGLDAVRTWAEAIAARPTVKASAVPDLRERFDAAVRKLGAVHAAVPAR